MSNSHDVIVLGLGGMGSAALYQLALRRKRVLGIEQFTPAHDRGSSHGKSRVTRQAYYEDPAYVPLLLRSYELWYQVERETNRKVLFEVGGLMIGPPNGEVVSGSTRSARKYGLAHEILDAKEIRRRFPPFQPGADIIALYERKAGFLKPEEGVRAHLDAAKTHGAELHFGEEVLHWEPVKDRVRVRTTKDSYEAERLVIAPGAWAPQVLADLGLPLEVERQILFWFDPIGGIEPFLPDRFPIFIWEAEGGATPYGFPSIDGPEGGAKLAFYRAPTPTICTPQSIDRTVHEEEVEQMREAVRDRIPSLNSRCLATATCMYTNTPDKNFILTTHPRHPQVTIACGFSGHGYKFCSVVGEICADLATRGETKHDIRLFHPDRLHKHGKFPGNRQSPRDTKTP